MRDLCNVNIFFSLRRTSQTCHVAILLSSGSRRMQRHHYYYLTEFCLLFSGIILLITMNYYNSQTLAQLSKSSNQYGHAIFTIFSYCTSILSLAGDRIDCQICRNEKDGYFQIKSENLTKSNYLRCQLAYIGGTFHKT
jgi:hypothetical protein